MNYIHGDIKIKLHLGNACYHLTENLSPLIWISKIVNVTYTKLHFFFVYYESETSSLLLREEYTESDHDCGGEENI